MPSRVEENQFVYDVVANASGDHSTIWVGADDLVVHGTFYWANSGMELNTGYTSKMFMWSHKVIQNNTQYK